MNIQDIKKEFKRIKPLPVELVYNYAFTVENSEGRYVLKVECYKESTGETYLVAYWEQEKTLFISKIS